MRSLFVVAFMLVGIAVALPSLDAFSFRYLGESAAVQQLRKDLNKTHPDLVQWLARANERIQNRKNATEEDLEDAREVLKGVRQKIYDFVTSPMYTIVTNVAIEQAISKIKPFLGVMPLREVQNFYNILKKDPNLQQAILDDDHPITDDIPGGKELDAWIDNSTQQIIADIFGPHQ